MDGEPGPTDSRGLPRRLILLAAAAALAAVTGCKTTESPGMGPTASGASYNLFYSPGDHMEELLRAGDLESASRLYERERRWFHGGGESREALLADLAGRLTTRFASAVEASQNGLDAIVWPADREQWADIKSKLEAADRTLVRIGEHELLRTPRYRPARVARLEQALASFEQRLEADAAQAFLEYPLGSGPSFVEAYPLKVELDRVLAQASWQGRLAGYDRAGLQSIARAYGALLPAPMARELGLALYEAATAEGRLAGSLAAVSEARKLGIELDEVAQSRAVLVDVTSRSLTGKGAIEFPTSIVADLPFKTVTADLDGALAQPAAAGADVVVLVDIVYARTDRRIAKREEVQSEVQIGTQTVPNPAYAAAQIKVNEAMLQMQEAELRNTLNAYKPCYGLGCAVLGLGGIIGEIAVGERLKEAKEELARTPPTLTEPVYAPYSYNRMTIEAAKVATVHYYVIDRQAGTYFRDTFDIRESKTFIVAYGLEAGDRHRASALKGTDDEEKVVEFESAPVEVKLSEILERFVGTSSSAEKLPDIDTIRSHVLADKNAAIAAEEARSYDVAVGQGDGRFDSVVVVYHPHGGLGSGFYVTGNIVLTNFHVIDKTRFVEIKLFDGLETTGKVIASDPRLDLALIKVERRGSPATFFTGRSLTLGDEVELIGHPDGFEFSITRGVVSAMREIESSRMPGGRKVRFIQTDAAANGGNSGGPMFLDGRVVGVTTWKLAAVDIEGLSFAVHYGEVLNFLARNGIVPNAGS